MNKENNEEFFITHDELATNNLKLNIDIDTNVKEKIDKFIDDSEIVMDNNEINDSITYFNNINNNEFNNNNNEFNNNNINNINKLNSNINKKVNLQETFLDIFKQIKSIVLLYVNKINNITDKKNKIITAIEEISKNKKLYFKDHIDNLNFQIELLTNEKKYLKSLIYSFLVKYIKDLNANGKHIIFLLTSLLNYNIKQNKNEILTKVKKIGDINENIHKITIEEILQEIEIIIKNTNHNLLLINEFNNEYTSYILELQNKFKKDKVPNLKRWTILTSWMMKKLVSSTLVKLCVYMLNKPPYEFAY